MHKLLGMIALLLSAPLLAETLPGDPTRPANVILQKVAKAATEQPYTLSWLLTGKQQNQAIVNGQRVRVGDYVDGARVQSVTPAGVTLEKGGRQWQIALAAPAGFSKVKSGK